MSSEESTHAQDTAGILQKAAQGAVPVMIPGARERRDGLSRSPVTGVVADSAKAPPHIEIHDRAQLEREREGGGAPRNRAGGGHAGLFARLRRMF